MVYVKEDNEIPLYFSLSYTKVKTDHLSYCNIEEPFFSSVCPAHVSMGPLAYSFHKCLPALIIVLICILYGHKTINKYRKNAYPLKPD